MTKSEVLALGIQFVFDESGNRKIVGFETTAQRSHEMKVGSGGQPHLWQSNYFQRRPSHHRRRYRYEKPPAEILEDISAIEIRFISPADTFDNAAAPISNAL